MTEIILMVDWIQLPLSQAGCSYNWKDRKLKMKECRTFYELGVAGFWWLTDRTGWNQIGLKSLSTMVSRKQLAWNNLWHGTCHMRISKGWLTWQQALPLMLLMADWRRLAWLWQDGTPNSINAPMRIHVPGGSSRPFRSNESTWFPFWCKHCEDSGDLSSEAWMRAKTNWDKRDQTQILFSDVDEKIFIWNIEYTRVYTLCETTFKDVL